MEEDNFYYSTELLNRIKELPLPEEHDASKPYLSTIEPFETEPQRKVLLLVNPAKSLIRITGY